MLGILSLNSVESASNVVLGAEVLALLLFVPFLAYLCSQLRGDAPSWLAAAALSAGIVAIAVKLAGVLPAILVEQGDLPPAIAGALTRFGDVSFMVSMMPLVSFLAAVAAVIVRSRVLPAAWVVGRRSSRRCSSPTRSTSARSSARRSSSSCSGH